VKTTSSVSVHSSPTLGERVLFYADYSSGVVGALSRISDSRFELPNHSPQLTIEFMTDEKDVQVRRLRLQQKNEVTHLAEALPLKREEVSFDGADAKLVGTSITPATPGPHPAIVLLHGSGPLTRDSFGPYPHFFSSLGMSVLVYDKRGTAGASYERDSEVPQAKSGEQSVQDRPFLTPDRASKHPSRSPIDFLHVCVAEDRHLNSFEWQASLRRFAILASFSRRF
jgi:dipeptidyl aminopeptidase/acylaminoacyl peptidase